MQIDRYWTVVRDRELKRLWEAGVPAKRISELIHVPVRAVYDRAYRRGYPPRRGSRANGQRDREIVADYLSEDGSLRKTAARFGLSFQRVHEIVSEARLQR